MTQTSIGPGPSRGGNENHDLDPRDKTLGEHAPPREPPAGAPMSEQGLDSCYAAVREAVQQLGPRRSELFLSMLCLALMARWPDADDVLSLIGHVRAQCDAEAAD